MMLLTCVFLVSVSLRVAIIYNLILLLQVVAFTCGIHGRQYN